MRQMDQDVCMPHWQSYNDIEQCCDAPALADDRSETVSPSMQVVNDNVRGRPARVRDAMDPYAHHIHICLRL